MTPSWSIKYFCGDCPRHTQPDGGFSLIDYVSHQHNHVETRLRAETLNFQQFYRSMKAIDDLLKSEMGKDMPAEMLRRFVQSHVDAAMEHMAAAFY